MFYIGVFYAKVCEIQNIIVLLRTH
jgi:hypothetical protein